MLPQLNYNINFKLQGHLTARARPKGRAEAIPEYGEALVLQLHSSNNGSCGHHCASWWREQGGHPSHRPARSYTTPAGEDYKCLAVNLG